MSSFSFAFFLRRRVYKDLRQAVYLAQERWRLHAAKSQMKKLKQEAKEETHFKS